MNREFELHALLKQHLRHERKPDNYGDELVELKWIDTGLYYRTESELMHSDMYIEIRNVITCRSRCYCKLGDPSDELLQKVWNELHQKGTALYDRHSPLLMAATAYYMWNKHMLERYPQFDFCDELWRVVHGN